jgi:hypothetical protein
MRSRSRRRAVPDRLRSSLRPDVHLADRRQALFQRLYRGAPSLRSFLASLAHRPPMRVPGTAVFLTGSRCGAARPAEQSEAQRVLHERAVVLKVQTEEVPQVSDSERVQVERLGGNFHRILLRSWVPGASERDGRSHAMAARRAGAHRHATRRSSSAARASSRQTARTFSRGVNKSSCRWQTPRSTPRAIQTPTGSRRRDRQPSRNLARGAAT